MNRQTLKNLAGPFFYNHIIKDLLANGEAQIVDDARGITLKYKVEAVGGN